MLFHAFASQDERRKFGGSCYIELQYCTLSRDTKLKNIVSIDTVEHWKNDSLYLHGNDMNEFWSLYNKIFSNGYYNNEKCGVVDMNGINYYTPEQTAHIIRQLIEEKPKDYQELLDWLINTEEFNGFYILGV